MLFATGDMHGDATRMWERVDAMEAWLGRPLDRSDEVMVLGDVGLSYGSHISQGLLRGMGEAGCRWVIMRGNHDDRYCRDIASGRLFGDDPWHEVEWRGGRAVESDAAVSVLFLPDAGGLYDLAGHPSLVIPGAWSPDAEWRKARRAPYEREEQLSWAEMSALADLAERNPIGMVFSHTCPLSWMTGHLSDLLLEGLDQSRVDKGMERFLDVILETVSPTLVGWWFGHFHDDRPLEGTAGHLVFSSVYVIDG